MEKIAHPALGEIDFDPADDSCDWTAETECMNRVVTLDMTFDGRVMSPAVLDDLARYVRDVNKFDQLARTAMTKNFRTEDSPVREYMRHHLEEFDEADVTRLFGTGPGSIKRDPFLSRLQLCRIGLYPDEPDRHAVFDYTIDEELTDYLICVTFDTRGKVDEIEMES